MSKILIGICAYGGLPFLKLGLHAIVKEDIADVLVVQAKPGDEEMIQYLSLTNFDVIHHEENLGFAAAINDMLDHAFVHGDYDSLIIMGNDVIPMEGAIGEMVKCADENDFEMVCGSEFNSRFLYDNYPEARKFFRGENLVFTDFGARPWLLHKDRQEGIEPHSRKDIRNFTLFKRAAFEKAGYADVGFFSNGYYEDLDACRRLDRTNVSACGLKSAAFFHFWSRTIHQGENRDHGKLYRQNEHLYREKWGGLWGSETYELPYHGDPYELAPGLIIQPELKISSRAQESEIINFWKTR